jgi:hypothetical protein
VKKRRVNIYVDDVLWLAFQRHCLEQRCTASHAIGVLVEEALARTTRVLPGAPGRQHDTAQVLEALKQSFSCEETL